jgi:Flp pilus assembly protein TadG
MKRRRHTGQNLVELVLTLPFVLILVFFIIEAGRVNFTFQGAKMAVMSGAHTAALYHNAAVGKQQLDNKLAATGLTATTASVVQLPNRHAYQATVTVHYAPFFGGVSIPTLSGPVSILPSQFDITYNAVEDVAVY